jgi:isopentenyldiphosphate isomerase
MSSELVDIVDEADVVVATVTRSTMRRDRLRHRATFVVVRSSGGQVLIHQRSDAKDLWPSRWDLCVGGVVTAGEGYDDAARRELAEEVGVTDRALVALGAGRYDDGEVSLLARIYTVTSDGPFVFADGEVVSARFVALDELMELVAREPFVPDSVALVLPLLSDPPPLGHTPTSSP